MTKPTDLLPQIKLPTLGTGTAAVNIPSVKPLPSAASYTKGGETFLADDPRSNLPAEVDEIVVEAPGKNGAVGGDDFRVRLKASVGQEESIYGPNERENILSPLHNTNGLLFPYTPSIQFNQDVDYRTLDMTHANGEYYAYSRTPSAALSVAAKFTVQNMLEGRYALAAIHFLRTCSKMYFGRDAVQDGKAGLPPPVLRFAGLGQYMFNDLKVILRSHNFAIDENAQLVRVAIGNSYVRLPSLFSISMTLNVINTPTELREDFNLDLFRTGALMKGWI